MGGRLRALAVACGVIAASVAVFWLLLGVRWSPTFVSFWNRPAGGTLGLTALYIFFGARSLLWYTRKLDAYGVVKKRGPVRLLPLAVGLAVFGSVMAWMASILVGDSILRSYRLLFQERAPDLTIVLSPIISFVQFLFSRSTIIWLLTAAVLWPAVARYRRTRVWLLAWYQRGPDPAPAPTLAFTRLWNVFGYLFLILSLLFQSP